MDGDILRLARPPSMDRVAQGQLRFLTCGSVDDGKSTLIGRLLHDTGQVPDDQLAALARDSARFGTNGSELDFALLLDGLEAEREQGITIDVAYRYFSTDRRSFVVADTPGHEQYTRNMATGASAADAAVILLDATRGVTAQTERHSRIVSLFGLRHVILAINKVDLVGFDRKTIDDLEAEYLRFAGNLGFQSITAIPLSARAGDNVVHRSKRTAWYGGPTLIEALEALPVERELTDRPFRFVVHYVNRPDAAFRGYAGTVVSGQVKVGQEIVVNPSGRAATISRIVTWDGDQPSAEAGDAVTLVMREAVDIARGDVIALPQSRPLSVTRFAATVVWMDDQPFTPDLALRIRIGARTAPARVELAPGASERASSLQANAIGQVSVSLPNPVAFDAFVDNPALGGFTLIDRSTGAVLAAGLAERPLDQSDNVYPTAAAVGRPERRRLNGHAGGAVWMTGLSGSGKSTIAALVEKKLHARRVRTAVLDGDNLRHGLNRDLGFSPDDRAENVRRVAEVARLFVDAGLITLCALISPTAAARGAARDRLEPDAFLEIFVNAPIDTCRARDPKGLYARAGEGRVRGLTGVEAEYEPPVSPDLVLDTVALEPEAAADAVVALLAARGWIPPV